MANLRFSIGRLSLGRRHLHHHARTETLLEQVGLRQRELARLGLDEEPFVLCSRNSLACAATLRAASDLRASLLLAPNGAPSVLAAAVAHAGVGTVVDHKPDGTLIVVQAEAREAAPRLSGWRRSKAFGDTDSGACVVATSGSGQQGSKLVAYRWAACQEQAIATVERTLRKAAPNGGPLRFIAASNIGHAYNLNGMFSALAGDAELCVPSCPAELAASLAEPTSAEATVLFGTPANYDALLRESGVRAGALRSTSKSGSLYAFSAGCPLPPAIRMGVEAALGVRVLQNYGSSETGNIALEEIGGAGTAVADGNEGGTATDTLKQRETAPHTVMRNVGVPWGILQLRPALAGALLPCDAHGEISILVPWASEGYIIDGELVPHDAAPFIRTGDAGRLGPLSVSGQQHTLEVGHRLRPPLELRRGGMRILLQQYEVEEALLRANPSAKGAAALQGPSGTLWCVLESESQAEVSPLVGGGPQPDRTIVVQALPRSPAGKVLYSQLQLMF